MPILASSRKKLCLVAKMVKAIDIDTLSKDDFNKLKNSNYRVTMISRGIYGINGAIVDDLNTNKSYIFSKNDAKLAQFI